MNKIEIELKFNEAEIYISMFRKTRYETYYITAREMLYDIQFELAAYTDNTKVKIRLEKRLALDNKELTDAYAYGWLK